MTETKVPTGPELAAETAEMFDACADALRGHHPFVQGIVLADLLAMWLAGYHAAGAEPEVVAQAREGILQEHIKAVRALVAENEKMLRQRMVAPVRHHH